MAEPPVKVAWAANQPQAELLQQLLLEYGIPSLVRRQLGFDLPDYLSAGARDILVPADAVQDARVVLAQVEPPPEAGEAVEPAASTRQPLWVRVVAIALVVCFLALWLWASLSTA